jgi:hypothetical protein
MKKPPFKPDIIKKSQLHTTWFGVVINSAQTGPPGISHRTDDAGTNLLEYRDKGGLLRGVLVVYGAGYRKGTRPGMTGQLLILTDPEYQRLGICSALLKEADRLGVPIDFEKQSYTRAGWRAVRKHLLRRQPKKS